MAVTPRALDISEVATGGSPVNAVAADPAGIGGGYIQNPYSATDQGFGPSDTPEVLFVNVVGLASTVGNGTTFALYPGQTFTFVPGQVTAVSVNALTSGHRFSGVVW